MQPIIGHEAIQRELRLLAASDDPPHALLFAGPEGTGRTALALFYARLLNCESASPAAPSLLDAQPTELPCGSCRACRLIAEGAHPDVITVAPGDMLCRPRAGESAHERHPQSRDIRICQVRGIIELAAKYPYEARYRVLLIDPAERLGRDAAHTLLKTLEEPPGHTAFALISAAPEAILETVQSRCRRIEVHAVGRDEIERGLAARGVEPAIAARAAAASRGRPGQAITFAARPEEMEVRGRLLHRCATIAAQRTQERFAYAGDLAERWRRDRAPVLAEIDAWEAFWEERLRQAAGTPATAASALQALKAAVQARADLQAQVLVRPALELMLLSFPRVTLAGEHPSEEDIAAHA